MPPEGEGQRFRLGPRVSNEIIVTAAHRSRFVLLPLFRFLLPSVSQLVKAVTASGVHLMTWRVETKGSFARRQVYTAEGLGETTFLLVLLIRLPSLLHPRLFQRVSPLVPILQVTVFLRPIGRSMRHASASLSSKAPLENGQRRRRTRAVINRVKKGPLLRDH